MRSPIGSLWVFVLGVLAYDAATRLGSRGERRWIAGLPVTWLVLGGWAVRRGGTFDRTLGNLAYGVFIGHLLSALLLLWTSDAVWRATGIFGIFGEHGVTEALWRRSFYAAALIGGALIYYGLERSLERVRTRLRQPEPVPAPAQPLSEPATR